MSDWQLAKTSEIFAVRDDFGNLIVAVRGTKPTPCYQVLIRLRPERILPPWVEVVWREGGGPCADVVTPYAAHSYPIPFPAADTVTVVTADGHQEVPIQEEPLALAAHALDGGGVTATGYSHTFQFDEAFQNAIDSLPQARPRIPDMLYRITVLETGADIGGFIGLHRMFVTVKRTPR
ncbi:MAG TPA: hypothetical protein VFQ91_19425 [Bryobacteraceae bacterium]|nr:hypothetical protein [Bryobacteraceae bacterium]